MTRVPRFRDSASERGESLAGLSRLLGRNDAYIQQYLRKGTPRRLPERERRTLARYFAVPESMLGGPAASRAVAERGLVAVSRSAVRASAGPGAIAEDQAARPYFAFDPRWLRALTATPSERLTMIRVEGDSMAPTLNAGDDILVDHADPASGCATESTCCGSTSACWSSGWRSIRSAGG